MKNKILIAAFAAAACVSVGSSEGLLLGIEGDYSFKSSLTAKWSEDGDFKHSWNKHSLLVGGDFTPEITNSFRLVAGAYTGVSFLKYKDSYNDFSGDSDSISKTVPGWVIGARLGGLYSFDEHNEIEFGYKADYTRYKASKLGEDIDKAYETNHGLYLGYNFKF